jgi:hypothetical protein
MKFLKKAYSFHVSTKKHVFNFYMARHFDKKPGIHVATKENPFLKKYYHEIYF